MTLLTTGRPPVAVRAASGLWLAAVALGSIETVIVVGASQGGDNPLPGVLLRCAVYAAAILTTLRMRAGRRWARLALALVLGVVGTLSLVIEPVSWLADGNSLNAVADDADLTWWAIAASRSLHVAAVWAAVPLMFTGSANAYFRHATNKPAAERHAADEPAAERRAAGKHAAQRHTGTEPAANGHVGNEHGG